MRAGTHTLIQALQAIPWTDDPDNDDEIVSHGSAPDSDSDEDDGPSEYISGLREFVC
jgi:sterol 3beta-glucosyltransferase